jgi:prophage maintenance system killer protein
VQDLIWIRDEVVIAIHRRQLAEHGGLEGIRDEGLLQSALCRSKNLLAYAESPPISQISPLRMAMELSKIILSWMEINEPLIL